MSDFDDLPPEVKEAIEKLNKHGFSPTGIVRLQGGESPEREQMKMDGIDAINARVIDSFSKDQLGWVMNVLDYIMSTPKEPRAIAAYHYGLCDANAWQRRQEEFEKELANEISDDGS